MQQFAHDEWLNTYKKDATDEHLAECWLKALDRVLAKEKMELYAFDIDHNEKCDPKNTVDPSGKLEV